MADTLNTIRRGERVRCWPFLLLGIFLPLVSFPLVLALLMWRFRRHVEQRLRAPVFRSERFASPDGREIVRRLHTCRGWLRNPLASVLLLQYVLCPSLILFQIFAVPAMVPRFGYERVLEEILEVDAVGRYPFCQSKKHYESLPERWLYQIRYRAVRPLTDAEAAEPALPVILGHVMDYTGRIEVWCDASKRLPYEGRCRAKDGTWHLVRVGSVGYRWGGTIVLGLILYLVFLPLQVGSGVALCGGLWLRFGRHRIAELLAVAYARDDARLRDTLLPLLKGSNAYLLWATFASAPLQGLLLAFYGPAVLDGHLLWEQAYGIGDALAGDGGRPR